MTSRELAEAEGWEAVTTRRLAERVEYSQPVLYSHFDGKDAIMRAVALEGFEELAVRLRPEPPRPLREVCRAYLDFATERPALYQAMFVLPSQLEFASPSTPAPLRAGFDGFVRALPPGTERPELVAEVVWSALHGIATLSAGGRIHPEDQDERLDVLLAHLAPDQAGNKGCGPVR